MIIPNEGDRLTKTNAAPGLQAFLVLMLLLLRNANKTETIQGASSHTFATSQEFLKTHNAIWQRSHITEFGNMELIKAVLSLQKTKKQTNNYKPFFVFVLLPFAHLSIVVSYYETDDFLTRSSVRGSGFAIQTDRSRSECSSPPRLRDCGSCANNHKYIIM